MATLSTAAGLNEDLYGPSTGRWLYNEAQHRAARCTRFDVSGLLDIAIKSVGATNCVSFEKIAEGAVNKVFLLQFDTGQEVIARIPSTGIVGNAHAITASEVATMDYLRRFCGVKLPKVLAWSASPKHNSVGCDYIIMERVSGESLTKRWFDIESADVWHVLGDVEQLEQALCKAVFSQSGSLYFKGDVSADLQNRPLFLRQEDNQDEAAELYRVGPSTNRLWWRGGRALLDAHRGPWSEMASCVLDAVSLTERSLASLDLAQNPFSRGLTRQDFLHLLAKCRCIASYIIPSPSSLHDPVLAHPDLNAANVLVEKEGTPLVRGYIDWQAAEIKPRFLNSSVPTLFIYTGNLVSVPPGGFEPVFVGPPKYSELTPEEQDVVQLHLRLHRRQDAYMNYIASREPHRRLMLTEHPELYVPLGSHAVNFVDNILYCASGDSGAYQDLSDALHGIVEHWPTYMPGVPCPVSFTAEERAVYEERAAAAARYNEFKEAALMEIGCDMEGWVPNEEYEEAKSRWEEIRRTWDEDHNGGPFPFQDGALVPSLG